MVGLLGSSTRIDIAGPAMRVGAPIPGARNTQSLELSKVPDKEAVLATLVVL